MKEDSLRSSARHYLLPDRLPEITQLSTVQILNINRDMRHYFQPDFFYSGAALLSPEGKAFAGALREQAGKCLGGGVIASRDLDWFGGGRTGPQPEPYMPQKRLFGYDNVPQSTFPSEWIALEFALILRPAFGTAIVSSWDDIHAVAITLKQGKDLHVRIDGKFPEAISRINAQANLQSIKNLMEIAAITGVPVYK